MTGFDPVTPLQDGFVSESNFPGLQELADQCGIEPSEVVRRLVLSGMKMFSGFASDQGFALSIDLEVVTSPGGDRFRPAKLNADGDAEWWMKLAGGGKWQAVPVKARDVEEAEALGWRRLYWDSDHARP